MNDDAETMTMKQIKPTHKNRDAQWYEKQYDPRPPDGSLVDILAAWGRRSEKLRATSVTWDTISYGQGEREKADIYRAKEPRGFLIFYHGGYWRSCSKDEHGWIAQSFLEAGLSVAILNYPLCPAASLHEIVSTTHGAFATLYQHSMTEAERASVIISGHSAGAYLAATHLMTDWTAYELPASPIKGVVCISGLFDLVPLVNTSMNSWLRLTQATASELSLIDQRPKAHVPLILGLGERESEEFHRQSLVLSQAWGYAPMDIIDVKGMNHFEVLGNFATPRSSLHEKTLSIVNDHKPL